MNNLKQNYSQIVGSETDIFFEIKSSYEHTTFPHSHDYYEFCLIVSGKQALTINDLSFEVNKGALIFCRPKDVHSKSYLENGEHITIAFPKASFDALFSYLGEGFTPDILLNPDCSPIVYLAEFERESIVNQLKKMFLAEIYNQKLIKVQYKIMLIQIFSKYFLELQLESKGRMPKWFEEVVMKMQLKENFTEGINAFLRLSGICHEHLCRMTKKYLNMTPTQFINNQRLNHAARLLLFSNFDISAICFDSGFGNMSHFYHQFKRKYGISPAKYKGLKQSQLIP